MRLAFISDLHLENKRISDLFNFFLFLKERKISQLLIGGDFGKFSNETILDIILEIRKLVRCHSVLFVFGNHDFFMKDINETVDFFHPYRKNHIFFLYNDFHEVDGLRILGTTYWCGLNVTSHSWSEKIRFLSRRLESSTTFINGKSIGAEGIVQEYVKAKEFLQRNTTENSIVLTHFTPSIRCQNEDFFLTLDPISLNFALNDDDDFIKKIKPKMWLCGHVHFSQSFYVGKTKVIQNTVGLDGFSDINYKLAIINHD